MNNFLQGFKLATTTLVGIGTAKITKAIIANNIEPETDLDTITVNAGSIVLGMMVADASKKYTDNLIDETVDQLKNLKDNIQAMRE